MTLANEMLQEITDTIAVSDGLERSPAASMYELLSSTLAQAAMETRLTHGLNDCAAALNSDPNDVVICILPWDLSTDSVNHSIQLLLVESLCLEYDILTLKVDMNQMKSLNSLSFGKLLAPSKSSPELNCYLIKVGSEGLSTSERKLIYTFRSPWSSDSENSKNYPD